MSLLKIIVTLFVANGCMGVSIWDLGTVPFGLPCTKVGLGSNLWVLNTHCMTYNGTVGCFDGLCRCNQEGDDRNYFDHLTQQCLGRVGAFCSAEHSSVFPDKQCAPHADCVPIQGDGYAVGKCQCRYGYKTGPLGGCEIDEEVSEGDRAPPRTTTTTQAPPREEFQLPDISLLEYVKYNESCQPEYLLNRTICNTHSRTVSCQSKKCLCNMNDDSIFDEQLDMCVGLVGTWCLARGNSLGYKVCVPNADCILENGNKYDDGYSFGTCGCVYGFKENANRTCDRDESIRNPSTPRIIVSPTTAPPSTTTVTTTTGSEGGDNGDKSAASRFAFSGITITYIFTIFTIHSLPSLLLKRSMYVISSPYL